MKFFYDVAHIGSRLAGNSGGSSGQNQHLHNTAWFFWYHCWVQCDEASVQPCQLTVSHTAAQQGTGLGAVVDSELHSCSAGNRSGCSGGLTSSGSRAVQSWRPPPQSAISSARSECPAPACPAGHTQQHQHRSTTHAHHTASTSSGGRCTHLCCCWNFHSLV